MNTPLNTQETICHLKTLLNGTGRLLALDLGTKTIGISMSDETRLIASPLEGLNRKELKRDIQKIAHLISQWNIQAMVVGYPIHLDGSRGEKAIWAEKFYQKLQESITIPMVLYDERWTTRVVERMLIEADVSRQRRAHIVDKLSACYLLQGVLDGLRNERNGR